MDSWTAFLSGCHQHDRHPSQRLHLQFCLREWGQIVRYQDAAEVQGAEGQEVVGEGSHLCLLGPLAGAGSPHVDQL